MKCLEPSPVVSDSIVSDVNINLKETDSIRKLSWGYTSGL